MADLTSADLGDELRSYFAVTAATELPRAVRQMSVRTLDARRRGAGVRRATAVAALAVVALVAVGIARLGSPAGGGAAPSTGAGPLSAAAPVPNGSFRPAALSYPGVDLNALARSGVSLLPPAGHGSAVLSAAQARSAAAAVATQAGSPGPALLAFVVDSADTHPLACFCWAVDVPVAGGVAATSSAGLRARTELVLVDADTGRVVRTLVGNGIP